MLASACTTATAAGVSGGGFTMQETKSVFEMTVQHGIYGLSASRWKTCSKLLLPSLH